MICDLEISALMSVNAAIAVMWSTSVRAVSVVSCLRVRVRLLLHLAPQRWIGVPGPR